jgi:E3 ubiquitin-protein ligase listerin
MEVLDFVYSAQQFVSNCLKEKFEGETNKLPGYLLKVVESLMEESKDDSPLAFYSATVLAGMISDLSEHRRITPEQSQIWLKSVDVRRGQDVFRSTAILAGFEESLGNNADVERLRNELASDLTGLPVSKAGEEGLLRI